MPNLMLEAIMLSAVFTACLVGSSNIIADALGTARTRKQKIAGHIMPLLLLAIALACLNTLIPTPR